MNKIFESEVTTLVSEAKALREKRPMVFYGSSSLRLWTTLQEDLPEIESLNLAFGGSTIQDCIDYFDVLFQDIQPKGIMFYAGDNDIGQGDHAETVITRFKALLKKIRTAYADVPFTFISIKPSPSRMIYIDVIRRVNEEIRTILAHEHECYFLDIHTAMLQGSEANPTLFCDDKLHMNAHGYNIWKEKVRGYLLNES